MNRKIWIYMGMFAIMMGQSASAGLLNKLTGSGPKRIELNSQSDTAVAFQDAFSENGTFAKKIVPLTPKNKRIVIAGFQAEFVTEQKGVNKGMGAGAGLTSSVETVYTLRGVDDQQLQRVTNKMYQAYVEQLTARGYEVLPVASLNETAYKERMTNLEQIPVHHERGVAMDVLFGNTSTDIDNASVIVTAQGTSPAVFSSGMFGNMGAFKAADTLNASIVHVRVKINFARFESSGWFMPGVDDKPQNGLGTKGTFVQVYVPGGQQNNMPLNNTILLPGRLAEQAVAVEASAGQTTQRATGGAVRALGGFLKGGLNGVADIAGGAIGSTHSVMGSGSFVIDAPANYEEIMHQDLTLASRVLVESFSK